MTAVVDVGSGRRTTWLARAGFALVTQCALDAGVRGGLGVVAATVFGLVTHALLAGVGLAALVMSSAEAFTIVKLVGRRTWCCAESQAAAVSLTLAPQFLDSSRALFPQMMILCAAHVLVAVGWLVLWTGVVLSGTVMIGLGVRAGFAAR